MACSVLNVSPDAPASEVWKVPLMATAEASRSLHRSSPPPPILIGEDAFVSEIVLDAWTRGGVARRVGGLLALGDGRRYVLRDAVRVLGRRNGDTDPYGFTGSVEAMRELVRRGATISADALRLGPAVYDIEYGYLVVSCDEPSKA